MLLGDTMSRRDGNTVSEQAWLTNAPSLDERPNHLVPQYDEYRQRCPLVFAHGLRTTYPDSRSPTAPRRRGLIWVPDVATSIDWPCSFGWRTYYAATRQSADRDMEVALRTAGVIGPKSTKDCSEVTGLVARKKVVSFSRVLPALHVAKLREHARKLRRMGSMQHGDGQCARRWVVHNEPICRLYHAHFSKFASSLLGTPMQPSYCYLVTYEPGAELPEHTDRSQCELTISLSIDRTPDEYCWDWPILIRHGRSEKFGEYSIDMGDCVAFLGRHLQHKRSALIDGRTATFLLLHFVSTNSTGSSN